VVSIQPENPFFGCLRPGCLGSEADGIVQSLGRVEAREAQSSAYRFLHQGDDPCLFNGGQLFERERGWPHGAFVEVRRVAES